MKNIEGHPSLKRLPNGSVINVDQTKYRAAVDLKRRKEKEKERIANLEKRVAQLERLVNGT